MNLYVYAFHIEEDEGEIFIVFPSFPEIISAIPAEEFPSWDAAAIQAHADDAVITALQAIMVSRAELPRSDDPEHIAADGFVCLTPLHAMKLELYRTYSRNCDTVAEFARKIDKQDTGARRLLNLRHRSTTDELIEALGKFNMRYVHNWGRQQMALIPTTAASPRPVAVAD